LWLRRRRVTRETHDAGEDPSCHRHDAAHPSIAAGERISGTVGVRSAA
jgi:hypothetical protein